MTVDQQKKKAAAQAAAKRKAAKRKKQKQRRALLFSALFFLIAVTLLIWAISLLKDRSGGDDPYPSSSQPGSSAGTVVAEKLPEGTVINGITLSGMTKEEAAAALVPGLEQQLSLYHVTLQNDLLGTKVLSAADMGLSFDTDAILSEAAAGGNISVVPVLDRDTLLSSLYSLNDTLSNHAENATVSVEYESYTGKKTKTKYTKPKFVYTTGQAGQQLDCESIISEIENALASGNTSPVLTPQIIISEPSVNIGMLKKQRTLLSSFSTTYYFSGTGKTDPAQLENRQSRDINITKAIGMMSYIMLNPGQSFSFNEATGNRSEKNGWALAKAVYQGGYRPEPGGGVCQVSTTMFNALVRAGVTITKHDEHSIPSDYVPLGWDATVDYGHIDFKFKNNKDEPIYIFIYLQDTSESSRKKAIVVEVYGPEEPGVEYRTRDEIVETDPAVRPTTKPDKTQYTDYSSVIQNAHDGYTVNIYVDKYVNGANTGTTFQYTAIYKKIEQITLVGTKPTPTPKPTKTPRPTKTPKPTPQPYNPFVSY